MPRAGDRNQLAGVTTTSARSACTARNVSATRGFIFTGEPVSPASRMARCARGVKVTRMYTATPMAWTALVMAPQSPHPEGDVTVVLRVTYNTLESIIRDEFMLTESRVSH